ncbi:MAG: HK97 family phage prohead protease [Clostridia bacterium]|nr:HK97 family phage prohead protease [Clostridia bacterium]
MTPNSKTKNKDGAEARAMAVMQLRALEDKEQNSYIVEGYAARYEPYVLYEDEDGAVYEQFTKENFEGADRSDIIMQYDHEGKVLARTGNGSLIVTPDDEGLHVIADLGRTEAARQLYEEIKAGMITKMSWRFSTDWDNYQFDREKRLLTYKAINKIWDVSAVSFPANDSTSISARNFCDGEIAKEKARIEAAEQIERRKAELIARLGGNS